MNAMRAFIGFIDRLNEMVGRLMGWLTILMVVNVFIVVVLRYAFLYGFVWMQELYIWIHATVFMLGAGYTLMHDGHVRIDLIYRTASTRYKAIVDILGSIFLAGPLIYLIFTRSWPLILRSIDNMERSAEAGGLPGVFLLKSVIAVFCILFGLQILALLLRSIIALITGQPSPSPYQASDEGTTS
ncbi:MAG: TRAP transporter small permease subunit [bacterium]|nr:TRAP transporter small permease subunit [bacterium]